MWSVSHVLVAKCCSKEVIEEITESEEDLSGNDATLDEVENSDAMPVFNIFDIFQQSLVEQWACFVFRLTYCINIHFLYIWFLILKQILSNVFLLYLSVSRGREIMPKAYRYIQVCKVGEGYEFCLFWAYILYGWSLCILTQSIWHLPKWFTILDDIC